MTPQPPSSSATAAQRDEADGFAAPSLNDVQERILDSLHRYGIAIFPFEELLGADLWAEALAGLAPFVREGEQAARAAADQPASKEDVILRRFYDKADKSRGRTVLSFGDPWLRITASELVLDVVNSYCGHWSKLFYVDNWYTIPFPKADERIGSQRWHRDPEDEHVVKAFVYCSDVDDEAGPFQYVRGSATGGRYGDLWSWGGGERHPKAGQLEAAVAAEDRLTVTGRAGTMIICDTGGFHRGGFARAKPRVLLVSTYLPATAAKAGKRRFDVDGLPGDLPPQVRFALE